MESVVPPLQCPPAGSYYQDSWGSPGRMLYRVTVSITPWCTIHGMKGELLNNAVLSHYITD